MENATRSSSEPPALTIERLTKTYSKGGHGGLFGRRRRTITVVDDVSIEIRPGEVFGFLGLNGAGKTTTLKMVLGLIRPTAGRVFLFGHDAFRPESRSRIGFAPERTAFYDYLTTRETLETLGRLSGLDRESLAERIPRLLATVALVGEENTQVKDFSKGMQQRLGIAQSMLADPDLLIFDEPTTGLDPFGRRIFKDLVRDLKQAGKTVFFSSHQLPDVQEICDRVGVIHRGKMIHVGLVRELIQGGNTLEEWFMRLLGEVDPSVKIQGQERRFV